MWGHESYWIDDLHQRQARPLVFVLLVFVAVFDSDKLATRGPHPPAGDVLASAEVDPSIYPFGVSGKQARRARAKGVQCSDCGAKAVGGHLQHDPTCPAARALDAQMVSDHAWFLDRPEAVHRCRPITAGERMEWGDMGGARVSAEAIVHVRQVKPGVRTRELYVPGAERVKDQTVGLFGHPATFEYLAAHGKEVPATQTGVLPTGLELRFFTLPVGISPAAFKTDEIDGVIVLPPGAAWPVPFESAT